MKLLPNNAKEPDRKITKGPQQIDFTHTYIEAPKQRKNNEQAESGQREE